ncbi:MAG: OadG family protein [Clostridia bacterium]|nr:OadG family protein [Clostridia bacterium]
MEISNTLAVGLGLGTVFVGLICLVFICYIMSSVVKFFAKSERPAPAVPQAATPQVVPGAIANKGEFAAAVAVAIAEDLGTDVTGIRIKSIKRL